MSWLILKVDVEGIEVDAGYKCIVLQFVPRISQAIDFQSGLVL